MAPVTNLVVALPSEARPLVERFDLRPRDPAGPLRTYEGRNIRLVVSGVGKLASAHAVGYLAGCTGATRGDLWINVGIAGHANVPVGTVALVHRIEDAAIRRAYYPVIAVSAPCPSFAVTCFDEPTTNYAGDALCDMESAGFFAAASRHQTHEFIHLLKVVSDNCAADIPQLDRAAIGRLVASAADCLGTLIDRLATLHRATHADAAASDFAPMPARWRFSATQQAQLNDLHRRWRARFPAVPWPPPLVADARSGDEVLQRLTLELARHAFDPDAG